jgi:prophage maintenance system killer protein
LGGLAEAVPNVATRAALTTIVDGNKRTALLAMIEFAERNGCTWRTLDEDDTVGTMVGVAAGTITEDAFVRWVADRLEQ